MTDVPTHDAAIFRAAQQALAQYRSQTRAPRTQNFAVAIAALLARARVGPSAVPQILHAPGNGPGLSTLRFQADVCDRVYRKVHGFAPPEGPQIYKPFTGTFAGPSPAQNNWRNSFDLQTGLSCDAPLEFLSDRTYLAESRTVCPFRNGHTGRCNSPAGLLGSRTCFNPDKRNAGELPGPDSTARPTAKLFTRGAADGERLYWIVEPTLEVLLDLLGHPTARVPLYPFMAVLYGGSETMMAHRPVVSLEVFRSDLSLSEAQFFALFDPDEASTFNALFIAVLSSPVAAATGGAAGANAGTSAVVTAPPTGAGAGAGGTTSVGPAASPITTYTPTEPAAFRSRAAVSADPAERLRLLEKAMHGHALALNALAEILAGRGLAPEEQLSGFDLAVRRSTVTHLFEVKTWRPENLSAQIRTAIAQLYEYRWRNRHDFADVCHLFLVFDHSPAQEFDTATWLKEYLVIDRHITPCWLAGGQLQTFAELQESLEAALNLP